MIVQCQRCHLRHDLTGRPPGTDISCRCGAALNLAPAGGETVALTCPQCGGSADESLARCQHCDSALATIRCPTCFGLAFDGNVHCPHCGDSLASPAVVDHDTGRQPLPCPRCSTDLDAMVVDKTLIDACPDCGGLWLDHTAFESIVQSRQFSDLSSALNIPTWNRQENHFQASEKDALYVRCPVCEHFMHRRNYARRSGIILDVCAAHGIWFDANELSRVFNYRIVDGTSPSMRPDVNNLSTTSGSTEWIDPEIFIRRNEQRTLSWGDGLSALAAFLATILR